MDRYDNVKRSRKEIATNNFVGGIFWALGATVGLAIIVLILGIVSKNINFIPYVGKFVSDTINFVLQNNPHLVK